VSSFGEVEDVPTGETPELNPNAQRHMNEIKAVDRAVVEGNWDMIPIASRDAERVHAAASAMGRRPNWSEVKKAPRIPTRPMILPMSVEVGCWEE
jgi:hypothetical protein